MTHSGLPRLGSLLRSARSSFALAAFNRLLTRNCNTHALEPLEVYKTMDTIFAGEAGQFVVLVLFSQTVRMEGLPDVRNLETVLWRRRKQVLRFAQDDSS